METTKMTNYKFRPATSARAKVRIAVEGAAGAGKTLGALLLAHGLGERIAVIDTETRVELDHKNNEVIGVFGRSEQYVGWDGHPLKFDACPMLPPYSPECYMDALDAAYRDGYDVVIVDSLSHEWAGHGGVLELVDAHPSRNKFDAWKTWTPPHRALLERILRAPCHVICTLRTKTAYEVVEENGKKVPKKLGLAPVAREGTDYEFDVIFGVDAEDHSAHVLKANAFYSRRLREEVSRERRLSVGIGRAIRAWADAGGFKAVTPEPAPVAPSAPTVPGPPPVAPVAPAAPSVPRPAAPSVPPPAAPVAPAAPVVTPETKPDTAPPAPVAIPPATPEAAPVVTDVALSLEDVISRIGRFQTRHAEDVIAAKPGEPASVSSAILNLASRAHGEDLVKRVWVEVGGRTFGEGKNRKRRSLSGAQLRTLVSRLPVKFPAETQPQTPLTDALASTTTIPW